MIKLLTHTRRPDITFCRNGRIHITARVARMLSITPGDSINIAFDDTGECYLMCSQHDKDAGRHVAQCYPTKAGGRNYCANSVRLARLMLDRCAITTDHASFMAGEVQNIDGRDYVTIIYKMPII